MSYTVNRPFTYLSGIHTNILLIFFVIIFSCLYHFLPVYTILIINKFYNICSFLVLPEIEIIPLTYRSVKLIEVWDCLKWHNYLTVKQLANIRREARLVQMTRSI